MIANLYYYLLLQGEFSLSLKQFRPHRSFEQSCSGLPANCLPRYNEATYVAIINTTRSGDNPDELPSYREFQDTINNNSIALLFIAIGYKRKVLYVFIFGSG